MTWKFKQSYTLNTYYISGSRSVWDANNMVDAGGGSPIHAHNEVTITTLEVLWYTKHWGLLH